MPGVCKCHVAFMPIRCQSWSSANCSASLRPSADRFGAWEPRSGEALDSLSHERPGGVCPLQRRGHGVDRVLPRPGANPTRRAARRSPERAHRLPRSRAIGLTEDELLGHLRAAGLAGHETTVNLIGNGTLALLRHPGAAGTAAGPSHACCRMRSRSCCATTVPSSARGARCWRRSR